MMAAWATTTSAKERREPPAGELDKHGLTTAGEMDGEATPAAEDRR